MNARVQQSQHVCECVLSDMHHRALGTTSMFMENLLFLFVPLTLGTLWLDNYHILLNLVLVIAYFSYYFGIKTFTKTNW